MLNQIAIDMSFNISKFIIGLVILVLGCKANSAKIGLLDKQQGDCPTIQRNFGDVLICLPEINGYSECFNDSLVQGKAKEEIDLLGDEIIGVYLNNELYSKFKNAPEFTIWNEHIQIWGDAPLKNKDVPSNFLNQIENKLRTDSEIILWDVAIAMINNGKIGFTLEKPALIEIYQAAEKVMSIIFVADYNYLGKQGKMFWITNMCILKKRLIYFAFYMDFDNPNVKKILKDKNDEFGKELAGLNI